MESGGQRWQRVRLVASGAVLPPRRMSNADVVASTIQKPSAKSEAHDDDASAAQAADRIHRQTGIATRRYAHAHEATSDLAADALRTLTAFVPLSGLRALIVATTSPDVPSPATAHFVHAALGLPPSTLAFDVASSCTSFLSAVHAGLGIVQGLADGERVAIVAAEVKHKSLGNDPRMRALFGDGAAALVFARASDTTNAACVRDNETQTEQHEAILPAFARVDAEFAHHIQIPIGGSRTPATAENLGAFRLQMNEPRLVYRHTVKAFCDAITACWEARAETLLRAGFDPDACPGLIYAHQANANILRDARERLPASLAARLPILLEDVGNMVCASLPVARTRLKILERLFTDTGFARASPSAIGSDPASSTGTLFRWELPQESLALLDRAGGFFLEDLSADVRTDVHATIAAGVHARHFFKGAPRIDAWVAAGGGFQTLGVLHGVGLPSAVFRLPHRS